MTRPVVVLRGRTASTGSRAQHSNWYTDTVKSLAKLSGIALLLVAAGLADCAGVVGTWNGRLNARFVPPAEVQQRITAEQVKQANDVLKSVAIVLTIRSDGTYTAVTKLPKYSDTSSKGKWKLKGKTLTLTPSGDGSQAESGTLGADGKTLTMSLPKRMTATGVSGKAVFRRR